MNFTTLQTELSQLINLDTSDATNLSNMKRWLNQAYKDISRYQWPWLERKERFQTIELYNTGTISVTKGSRTITGSGTTFTSAMVGRYINIVGRNDWYRIIAYGSATSITVDYPILTDSESGKSYQLWNRYYELNSDVRSLSSVYLDVPPISVAIMPKKEFPEAQGNTYQAGNPTKCQIIEIDKSVRTYTTGTVSGTINTKTLTGSGTSWLDNVMPGDKITTLNYSYWVLSVDSDTSLTLTGNLMETVTASSSYTRTRYDTQWIEFDYTPNSPARNVTYRYIKRTYDMQNDSDLPELPEEWHEILVYGAQHIAYKSLDDPREAQALTIYENKLAQMRKEILDNDSGDSWTWFTIQEDN